MLHVFYESTAQLPISQSVHEIEWLLIQTDPADSEGKFFIDYDDSEDEDFILDTRNLSSSESEDEETDHVAIMENNISKSTEHNSLIIIVARYFVI